MLKKAFYFVTSSFSINKKVLLEYESSLAIGGALTFLLSSHSFHSFHTNYENFFLNNYEVE